MRRTPGNILAVSCLFAALACVTGALAQQRQKLESGPFREATVPVSARDSTVLLSDQFVVKGSEKVLLDSAVLAEGRDYLLDDRFGVISFLPSVRDRIREDSLSQHVLTVRYRVLPFRLKERYQHRELVVRKDTTGDQRVVVARPTTSFTADDLFGANLQKSGSIVRGFTIGSNRDLSLTSGFRMQMAGKIASDIDVVAALTDENTPIQPEGNTQTLQEIDKVFVEIRSTNVAATLGDFTVDFTGNEFGNFHRKLQGAKGVADYRTGSSGGSLVLSGAVTRGKFTTNQFQGIEGVQGPYRLTGSAGERTVIVIAGTEKVYIDGELMTRGETNDYTIDYASAELTFTSRRLVTGVSRIVVDFEYTDRQFVRNLVGGKGSANFWGNDVALNVTYIREADDQDAPIDLVLSDADREILRSAGGDRLKASRTGADSVGPGRGQYVAVDTTVGGLPVRFYRFAPGDSSAHYNVFFSFIGAGLGDYTKVTSGNFRYVGPAQGSYLPVRFLPLPQLQSLADVDLKARITDYLHVSGEYALSVLDANRFSTLDDADANGSAVKFGLRLNPKDVRIGSANMGSFDLILRERFVDRRFNPVDRTNEIEFDRKWNVGQRGKVDEEIREGMLSYSPINALSLMGGLGWIKRGDQFTSNRTELQMKLDADQTLKADYALEIIRSRDGALDDRASWTRHKGTAEYTTGVFTPGFRYQGEIRRSNSLAADTMKYGSFRFNEFAPHLMLSEFLNMSFSSEFSWRIGDSVLSGLLQRESRTFTQEYAWRLKEWSSFSASADVTLRKKMFTESFRARGNGDIETILIRFQSKYAPLNRGLENDIFYETASQRASKPERLFVRVPRGTGNYRYLGDVNGNGVVDQGDFQFDRFDGDYVVNVVPSDQLFPVVDLKASMRLRLTPSRFVQSEDSFSDILKTLSSETYLRVEEKSRESVTSDIYLLRLSRFLNDSTTIAGSNLVSQDIFVFENRPELSFRLRYVQRNGFAQFDLGNERSYNRERSLRIRWQLVREISNQTDYVNKRDNVTAPASSGRSRDITANSMTTDWSYRPEQAVELGFVVGVGRATDRDSVSPLTADLNEQAVRLVYSFEERGQARGEFRREEVQVDGTKALIPFELTGGRIPGKTWLWRIAFEYRLTQFIQSSLVYDGRSEGGGAPVHTARAEVRAFF